MNCAEFEAEWRGRLDAARAGLVPLFPEGPEADAHASACATCRELEARYSALVRAIGSLPAPPAHDPELSARILAAWTEERDEPRTLSFWAGNAWRSPVLRYGAAAAVALACLGGLVVVRERTGRDRPAERSMAGPVPPARPAPKARPLGEALSEAAGATLALARESSAPAARIGRDVIGSAAEVVGPAMASAGEAGEAIDEGSRPALLERLGGEVGSPPGAGAWSAPARNAFGFLVPRLPGGGADSPSGGPQPL